MTNLQNVQTGENKFCGPAVLSAIAGITTDEAEKLIQSVRKNNGIPRSDDKVTGVWAAELNDAFRKLGWKVNNLPNMYGKSVYFIMTVITKPAFYLFYVHRHVVAIEISTDGKRYLIDNHTKQPISVGNSARISQKVLGVTMLVKGE